jgi:hypothetical protein
VFFEPCFPVLAVSQRTRASFIVMILCKSLSSSAIGDHRAPHPRLQRVYAPTAQPEHFRKPIQKRFPLFRDTVRGGWRTLRITTARTVDRFVAEESVL